MGHYPHFCTPHLSVSKELTEWRQSLIMQLTEVREILHCHSCTKPYFFL